MNHPPTYVRTFSLHKVRKNCHFLYHPPTLMSLRNLKMAPKQAMTEAAFFTIGRSRTIGYGKIRPLADYRSRSRMLIFFLIFLTFILFIDSSSSIHSFNQFLTRPCENWTLIILTHLIFQKFNPLGVKSLGD